MRVITVCLALALTLGACGRREETNDAGLADGASPSTLIAGRSASGIGDVAEPVAAIELPSDIPTISPLRPLMRRPTTIMTTVSEPRPPTPAETAAAELDALRLFRACLRREADAAASAEQGRAYWRTLDGDAVLHRCAEWSGLAWPPRSWGGGPDDNPNEEEL